MECQYKCTEKQQQKVIFQVHFEHYLLTCNFPFDLNLPGTEMTSWTSPKGRSEFFPKITFWPWSAKTTKVSQESQDFIFTQSADICLLFDSSRVITILRRFFSAHWINVKWKPVESLEAAVLFSVFSIKCWPSWTEAFSEPPLLGCLWGWFGGHAIIYLTFDRINSTCKLGYTNLSNCQGNNYHRSGLTKSIKNRT